MATRAGNRNVVALAAATAITDTRLILRGAPRAIRLLARTAGWVVASVVFGLTLGVAAVILPPTGAFGVVALAAVVLLWVMPDLPVVSTGAIRKTFFVMLAVDLCVPFYYTVQVAELPWISARRVATFALVAPFSLALASSPDVRGRVAGRMRSSRLICVCAFGYLAMAFLSVFTSVWTTQSASFLSEVLLTWYVPFVATIYVIENEEDVRFLLKVICCCALFITAAGVLEFFLQRRYFFDIYPKPMLDAFLAANPIIEAEYESSPFRNGLYRASSIFGTPLSFGEFEIIVAPIGLYFAAHGRSAFERALGWVVALGAIVGVFVSGSRGAYIGLFVSAAVFLVIWAVRKAIHDRASLAPALIGLLGAIGFGSLVVLVSVWRRAHNIVLGGAEGDASNQGRYEQWLAALPSIKSNPVTGTGVATGAYVINSSTIDSYYLSVLIETGVPGFLFFTGMICAAIWYGLRRYPVDKSQMGAAAGALACSFIAFGVYRAALSQTENHMLFFSFLAIFIVISSLYDKTAPAVTGGRRTAKP